MTDDLARRAAPIIDAAVGTLGTACVLLVERRGERSTYAAGTLCPDERAGPDGPCTAGSLFDLASLTKLATTALVLALVRERALELATPLRLLVPDFRGGRKDEVTVGHVLTHTGGIAWHVDLWRECRSADEALWRAAQEPLAQDLGTFRYSDLGFLLLTAGLERVTGAPFADALHARVVGQIDAGTLAFGPREPTACAATEDDIVWRMRRLRGEVHDENASLLGGIAGHAGLFGTAADVAALARVFRDGAVVGNELARLARREHARGDNARRGLGLALRAPIDAMCGRHFSAEAWGHTGFTGTSLWVDPASDLTVVLLTNRVYHGRTNDEPTWRFRVAVHEAVSDA